MASERFSVSVAIPAYNEAGRLAETVCSIRSQTEPPAEIIVVDDGSTDRTADVAQELGVRVFRQSNSGVASARNTGIRAAREPWVAFCDADDLWCVDKLERMRHAHELRPEVDFLFGDFSVVEGDRVLIPSTFANTREFAEHVSIRLDRDTVFFERSALAVAITKHNFVQPSTVVVRRQLIFENNVFFDADHARNAEYFVAEDLEWYLRLLRFTDALAVDRIVERYRQRAGSLSSHRSRMHFGLVKLGEIVTSQPDGYVAEAAATFASMRRRHLLEAAVAFGRELCFRQCRDRLKEAQRVSFVPRDQLLYLVAALATLPGITQAAAFSVRAWQRVIKPALRSLRS